jgi:TPR repeat protein
MNPFKLTTQWVKENIEPCYKTNFTSQHEQLFYNTIIQLIQYRLGVNTITNKDALHILKQIQIQYGSNIEQNISNNISTNTFDATLCEEGKNDCVVQCIWYPPTKQLPWGEIRLTSNSNERFVIVNDTFLSINWTEWNEKTLSINTIIKPKKESTRINFSASIDDFQKIIKPYHLDKLSKKFKFASNLDDVCKCVNNKLHTNVMFVDSIENKRVLSVNEKVVSTEQLMNDETIGNEDGEQQIDMDIENVQESEDDGSDIEQPIDDQSNDINEDKQHFTTLQQKSKDGDAHSQSELGDCYQTGKGCELNKQLAFDWYTMSAKQGSDLGQCALGECYENGIGCDVDETQAVKWYTNSADQDNVWAQIKLGRCYLFGTGCDESAIQSVKWYTKAANQDSGYAQYELGLCYENGSGVEKNDKTSFHWYSKSAAQANNYGEYGVGRCYENGIGCAKSQPDAIKWYKKAAKQEDNTNAIDALQRLNVPIDE